MLAYRVLQELDRYLDCTILPSWSTYMLRNVWKIIQVPMLSARFTSTVRAMAMLCVVIAFLGSSGCVAPPDEEDAETSAMERVGEIGEIGPAEMYGCSSWIANGCCRSTEVKEKRNCSGTWCDATGCWEDTWTETRCRSVAPLTCY